MRKYLFIVMVLLGSSATFVYGEEQVVTNKVEAVAKESLKEEEPTEGLYFMRASKQAEAGKYDEAVVQITEALKLNSKNWRGYELRGKYYMQSKKWPEALKDFDKLIELQPQDVTAYSLRSNAKQQMGDTAGAKEDLKKGKEILRSKKYIPPVHVEEAPPLFVEPAPGAPAKPAKTKKAQKKSQ